MFSAAIVRRCDCFCVVHSLQSICESHTRHRESKMCPKIKAKKKRLRTLVKCSMWRRHSDIHIDSGWMCVCVEFCAYGMSFLCWRCLMCRLSVFDKHYYKLNTSHTSQNIVCPCAKFVTSNYHRSQRKSFTFTRDFKRSSRNFSHGCVYLSYVVYIELVCIIVLSYICDTLEQWPTIVLFHQY